MIEPCGIVTFTTDFGVQDTFPGEMKGAALSVSTGLTLVDISHEVPSHDIHIGAFMLYRSYRSFPAGTVHVAVVDPGVGTDRRALAMEADDHLFIAPDNGLLSRIITGAEIRTVHEIERSPIPDGESPSTFDGRDLFAPAAARLASGMPLQSMGPVVLDPVVLELSRQAPTAAGPVRVRILMVDRFGNATLDLPGDLRTDAGLRIDTPGGAVSEFRAAYAAGERNSPFLIVNSAGYLEIAVREGNAAERLGLEVGDTVICSVD